MKTVGTKLDNSEFEKFDQVCHELGLTRSEQLRELIKEFNQVDIQTDTAPTVAEPKPKVEPEIKFVFD